MDICAVQGLTIKLFLKDNLRAYAVWCLASIGRITDMRVSGVFPVTWKEPLGCLEI